MTAYLQLGSYQYSELELAPLSWVTTYSLHSSVFTATQSASDYGYLWFCRGNTQGIFSQILPRPLRGKVCVTMLLLGRC